MSPTQFGALVGVSQKTVSNWLAAGMPGERNEVGHWNIDPEKAREWMRISLSPGMGRGGVRQGAGRPPGGGRAATVSASDPIDDDLFEPPTVPATIEDVDALAEQGRLTKTGLELALKAIDVRRKLREEAEEAAKLLAADDVRDAWTAGLARLSVQLGRLSARIASRLTEIGLPASSRHAATAMVEVEVDACRTAMVEAYAERAAEGEAGADGGSDAGGDSPAGVDAAEAAIGQ